MMSKIFYNIFGVICYEIIARFILLVSYILSIISTGISTFLCFLLLPFLYARVGYKITNEWISSILESFFKKVLIDGFYESIILRFIKENSVKK